MSATNLKSDAIPRGKALRAGFILLIIIIAAISAALRIHAARTLRIDNDEKIYLQAALDYNNFMRVGRWSMLVWNEDNSEHPAFYKVVYGLSLFAQPPLKEIPRNGFPLKLPFYQGKAAPWALTGRYLSAALGVATTLLLTAVNPLAGLFFAADSLAVKFTSTFYLEALPVLCSLLAALFYLRWYSRVTHEQHASFLWLVLSAGCLGAAGASKYNYAVMGAVIAVHYSWNLFRKNLPLSTLPAMSLWALGSVLFFFACDVYLWRHPLMRLAKSLTYHANYPSTEIVDHYSYPLWQPFVWLATPYPLHFPIAAASIPVQIDALIALLALAGLPGLYKRRLFFLIWLVLGLATVLAWPTKWPQYPMILMAPFCVSAGEGVRSIYTLLRAFFTRSREVPAASSRANL